jgi:tetratricopeptide (TPR) repeat protein
LENPLGSREKKRSLYLPIRNKKRINSASLLEGEIHQPTRTLQAEVEIEFEEDGTIHSTKKKSEITLYGTGALRWDSVARAAAFITSTDPAIIAFSRPPLVHFEQQLKTLGRQQLIQLYLALRQYDTAIQTATDYLLKEVGDMVAIHNQLGVAHFLKGDVTQAAYFFKQAVALRPADKELQQNLDRALQQLGMAERPATETASRKNAGKAKGATEDVGVDGFYWLE